MDFIKWLEEQDTANLSQFTIDWMETAVDSIDMAAEMAKNEDDSPGQVLASAQEVVNSFVYEAKNILAIMRPELPDVLFFNEIVGGSWGQN